MAQAVKKIDEKSGEEKYLRFDKGARIEHALLILSFTVLTVTGLPQKYPETTWAAVMITMMGGIELTRIIHRVAAVLLMLSTIYHGGILTYKVLVLRVKWTMMPSLKDVKDAWQTFAHNLGWAKEAPKMGRYTYGEKFEYWAVIWGTVVMIITGFMLWNPIATTSILPGAFVPAAKAAHGGEALLAVLAIITWHFYNVHFKHFNRSIFTGWISRHEMKEEHALELEAIEAGEVAPQPDPEAVEKRRRIFMPAAVIITVVLLTGLYFFVTFEQTAITTLPADQINLLVTPTVIP
jgi:formate dehydrogenase gamma subunit